ncbi:unnamed protein product [Paramecium sonneborni]|uniref:Uncharacterized protein n=1 Tax=Paramecium sonneborni TaxID=65129 RepID=A0A8S1RH06_9CILI|nr:unnamed protein product [Paramecium sonneborni]
MNNIFEEVSFLEEPYYNQKSNSIIRTNNSIQHLLIKSQLNPNTNQQPNYSNAAYYDRTICNSNIIVGSNISEEKQDEIIQIEDKLSSCHYKVIQVAEKDDDNQFLQYKIQ